MSIIRKNRIGLFIVVAALILNLFIFKSEQVKASTITNLKFGSTVSGNITDTNNKQIYKIVLAKSGTISINTKSYLYDLNVSLYLNNDDDISNYYIYNGAKNNPSESTKKFNLEAGTYYINVNSYSYTGKYNLKVSYTTSGSNEIEPNNGKEQAQNIKLNTQSISGILTETGKDDYYKVILSKAGSISINIKSYMEDMKVSLFSKNSDDNLPDYYIYNGEENNPSQLSKKINLEAGTYYINVSSYSYTGKYNLKVDYNSSGNNEIEPNDGTEQAQKVNLNTQTISGILTETDKEDYYKIILPKSGTIKINTKAYLDNMNVSISSKNREEDIDNYYIYNGSENNPSQSSKKINLEAGTYYINVNSYSYTGKYNLKVDYTSSGSNETESNNGTEQAQKIDINIQTITGFISKTDNEDYYKIYVAKPESITFKLKSYIGNLYFEIYDSMGNNVGYTEYIYNGSEFTPKLSTIVESVDKGTYYIKVSGSSYSSYEATGKYILNVQCKDLIVTQPLINEVNNKSTTITGKTIANGTVTVKIGSKAYTGKSNSKGAYSIKIPVQKESSKLYVTVKNSYGYSSSTKIVTVLDRIAPSAPAVNTITTTSKTITGKTEANATVIAYVGNKQIGSAKADKNGNYSIKIATQKVRTKVSVVAVDGAKNKSSAKTVTVALIPGQPSVNEVNNKSAAVSGKTIANGTVAVKIGSKTYTGKSNSKGAYSIKIPVQKAGAKLYVTVKNSYGHSSSTKTVIAVDRIAPSAPAVNTITTASKAITGKTETNSTVIAYIGNKQIGSAKADKNGKYTIKIANQKSGTKVNVVSVDGAKNRSAARISVVKK
ncbi:Ig-like domain-containing protein [Clostridium pasteurianum]|uniref:Ig-like domain-containing protein n=1 Tax=Clostridium pasteurianum TaxID=1501 RepID=UPI002260AB94|nr:Ig-like domain-containing protein [Clostridium pasteurianum]UZW15008.1 Ig-like domain-containing protein [Clostridium pasteurianum]